MGHRMHDGSSFALVLQFQLHHPAIGNLVFHNTPRGKVVSRNRLAIDPTSLRFPFRLGKGAQVKVEAVAPPL
jgi:hypothetical protein